MQTWYTDLIFLKLDTPKCIYFERSYTIRIILPRYIEEQQFRGRVRAHGERRKKGRTTQSHQLQDHDLKLRFSTKMTGVKSGWTTYGCNCSLPYSNLRFPREKKKWSEKNRIQKEEKIRFGLRSVSHLLRHLCLKFVLVVDVWLSVFRLNLISTECEIMDFVIGYFEFCIYWFFIGHKGFLFKILKLWNWD